MFQSCCWQAWWHSNFLSFVGDIFLPSLEGLKVYSLLLEFSNFTKCNLIWSFFIHCVGDWMSSFKLENWWYPLLQKNISTYSIVLLWELNKILILNTYKCAVMLIINIYPHLPISLINTVSCLSTLPLKFNVLLYSIYFKRFFNSTHFLIVSRK